MTNIFDYRHLQNLADQLDLSVGVELRKRILRGNERLTLTDTTSWTNYFSEVISRLNNSVDEEKRRKILSSIGPLFMLDEKSPVGHSSN